MKIVGVSLGTRNGSNDSMCKEALIAAQEMGAEGSFIHLLDWDIKDCTGCVACSRSLVMGKGNVCTRKDEFDDFRSQLLDAVQMQHGKILEEICLCDPGMIICCGLASSGIKGNAALLKDHVLPVSTEWASFQSRTFDRDWQYYFTEINKKQIPVISFCHPQVTNLNCSRGHENLFIPLFQDMLYIKELFLKNTAGSE